MVGYFFLEFPHFGMLLEREREREREREYYGFMKIN